ncbi:MAG: carboxymuconolactone decarboxylase family protein, partial [Proteobacteria bacterium]
MQKLNYFVNFKAGFEKLSELENLIKTSSLDPSIRHLVKIYASQINGCAFCVDMHVKEARIDGERELRIYHIPVWFESPLFSEKEKAALAWTKAITHLASGHPSDELFQETKKYFDDKELTELNMAIGLI